MTLREEPLRNQLGWYTAALPQLGTRDITGQTWCMWATFTLINMACDLFVPIKMLNRTGICWSLAGVGVFPQVGVRSWICTFWGPLLDLQHKHLICSALPIRTQWEVLELLQSIYMICPWQSADLILGDCCREEMECQVWANTGLPGSWCSLSCCPFWMWFSLKGAIEFGYLVKERVSSTKCNEATLQGYLRSFWF